MSNILLTFIPKLTAFALPNYAMVK